MNDQHGKEWYTEGLRRLIKSVRKIPHFQVASSIAIQEAKVPPKYELLKEIPEYMEWRTFLAEITEELGAAVQIGSEHSTDLIYCRKLFVALRDGYYRDDSLLIFDAIVELEAALDALAKSNTKSATVVPAEKVLLDNDSAILEQMLSMGATANSPASRETILSELGWTSEGKRAFVRLKDYGYVKPMRGVGFYLTEAGIARAKTLTT